MSDIERCRDIVAGQIAALAPDPAHLSPHSRAALANLRRGVGKAPGAVPAIWQYTLPDARGGTAWGDRREVAVHVALTQWAMHQQSKTTPMHRRDRRFGAALRLLASSQDREKPQETPAYRRMMALASARNIAGITTHARGLIAQLRTADLAFDYGRWADDLELIQVPGRALEVQRQWGRDFYRLGEEDVARALDASVQTSSNESEGDMR